ncbi:MAG: ATP-binding protein [Alkalispirochaeta sp.]
MAAAEALFEQIDIIQNRLYANLSTPARQWAPPPEVTSHHAVLLHGPRGVGKTQYLLRWARECGGMYCSMDHPLVSSVSVYDLVADAFSRGITDVFLDEIHTAPEWSARVKALCDSFPGKRIRLSGSNSLLMSHGIGDLSRRVLSLPMPFVSFREYLSLTTGHVHPLLDPFQPESTDYAMALAAEVPVLTHFEKYLAGGVRPIGLDHRDVYPQLLLQAAQKTMEGDIPFIVPSITVNHFRLMNAVLGYLATAPIPTIQVNSLSREWNVGKEKLYSLLHAMEQTGLVRIVRKSTDHKAMSIGAKIFLADPSMYRALAGADGNAREAYAACAIESAGRTIRAEIDERRGDFVVDGTLRIEVGGPGKERKRSDYVIRDRVDVPAPNVVPLWMLGMMW